MRVQNQTLKDAHLSSEERVLLLFLMTLRILMKQLRFAMTVSLKMLASAVVQLQEPLSKLVFMIALLKRLLRWQRVERLGARGKMLTKDHR